MIFRIWMLIAAVFLPVVVSAADIGVYYFPGWKKSPPLVSAEDWQFIKPYPERKPLLGWYPEGDVSVAEKQLDWMYRYGISFVIYDWYWTKSGVSLDHAINAYLKSRNREKVRFSLLWANHTQTPQSLADFDAMVQYWIKAYFVEPGFYELDGKPVVFVFSHGKLEEDARKFDYDAPRLLARAREAAVRAGLKGIYFVACTQALSDAVNGVLPAAGYDALSDYNYHFGLSGSLPAPPMSRSFEELSSGYKKSWEWILRNSELPYFIPMTSGWDKRPWGGTKEQPDHDNSHSTPASFRKHLDEAKKLLEEYPDKTRKIGVICCWNEYGEGSYIEPTEKFKFQYLEAIRDVFGTPK